MNKTIQNRITLILILSIIFIGITGSISLYYISQISRDIDEVLHKSIKGERSLEKIKEILLDLKRAEKTYILQFKRNEPAIDISSNISNLQKAIGDHEEFLNIPENLEKIKIFQDDIIEYQAIIYTLSSGETSINSVEEKLTDLTSNMLSIMNSVLSARHNQLELQEKEINVLIENAKRNMLFILFLLSVGGFVLILLAPRQVTAPFKKYIAALKEIEELKFDTRLPIVGNDEVAHLGKSINRLIDRFQMFDEMKQKRIQFEKSKQRVLANILDQGVMMLSIEGEVLFLNAQLAKILDLNIDSYQGKNYNLVDLPGDLKEMVKEVLRKKEKVDSRMMIFNYRAKNAKEEKAVEVLVDVGLVRNYRGDVVNLIITFEDITNSPGESVFKRISISEQKLI